MIKRLRWVIVAIVALALLLVLRMTLFRAQPIEVETAVIGRGGVEDAVMNSQAGTVKSRRRSRLGAERAGPVVSIPHREGSRVKRGEVLLELDASTARMSLEAAERDRDAVKASRESARAAASLAAADFERTRQLRDRDVVSQGEMDAAQSRRDASVAEFQAAEARLRRAESAVRLARNELEHLRVLAPFDGAVSNRFVEVGESVIPGQSVLELTSLSHLYVSAPRVAGAVPTGYGSATVEYGGRGRRVYVYGVNSEIPEVWTWKVAVGENLPKMDWDRTSSVTMLGARLKRELFGDANPLGAVVRIGEARFRVSA